MTAGRLGTSICGGSGLDSTQLGSVKFGSVQPPSILVSGLLVGSMLSLVLLFRMIGLKACLCITTCDYHADATRHVDGV